MRRDVLVTAALVALSGSASAGPRDDVLAGIGRCGMITDDRTWLNCVYGAAQPMRVQLGLPPAPASQVGLVPPVSASAARLPATSMPVSTAPRQSGGFWAYLMGGAPLVTNVPLTAYRFDSQGWFTVTLTNGQVWEQTDGPPLAHWRGPASRLVASISKGATGSFNLTIADEGIEYKVRQIR